MTPHKQNQIQRRERIQSTKEHLLEVAFVMTYQLYSLQNKHDNLQKQTDPKLQNSLICIQQHR